MAEPEPSKFAHFESIKETNLLDLYTRHAEVARDIHQDSLRRFTGNDTLMVDLVRESPILPKSMETLDHLEDYDVVSVSSGLGLGSVLFGDGIAGTELVSEYKNRFAEADMPVYVVAAGNEGRTGQTSMARVADFARNSFVVGEANAGDGSPYVEDHSSRINPTLTADSPFNRGELYQYYNVSPSLEGHEDLVTDWVIENEINTSFDLVKEYNKDQGLDEDYWYDAYNKIYEAKYDQLTQTPEGRAWVQEQVDAYMADPQMLHAKVIAEFEKTHDIDENGYATGLNGTSFSAPEQAGYISGALYEQEQREEDNLPILTKDEITTLAKMATVDTTAREGEEESMYSFRNDDGHEFVAGGGHGVFNPDMFRALLDESYKKIGTDPDIDRTSVTATMGAEILDGRNGSQAATLSSNLPEGTNMVIDRMRLDTQYKLDGSVPHYAVIEKPDEEPMLTRLQMANTRSTFIGWSRMEHEFGESLSADDHWKVHLHNGKDAALEDLQVTVYGYNQGGLMDQMMEYSKQLAVDLALQPEVTPEALTPALESSVDNVPTLNTPR